MQRRTLGVLAATQVAGGVGTAVGLAFSSVLVAQLSGSAAVGGFAGTATVLGAALLALPMAQLAAERGRRAGLSLAFAAAMTGCLINVVAVAIASWPLLLAGLVLMGGGSAGNLAARYAATDLSPQGRAGTHLALVVWAATIGSVVGPNLAGPAAPPRPNPRIRGEHFRCAHFPGDARGPSPRARGASFATWGFVSVGRRFRALSWNRTFNFRGLGAGQG
ncbi:hypothetical protein SAMN05421505_114123 [Sinosporangium album]|uniref:Major facilitator superfamily (MFS) profile domain-containing protein n=1 Tax=Sinosporangium album TaxID=504805 RepID=A0A1G8BQM7_9ACTN|nr:hypothetical protein SAMN05421505_114123 [Sinosporangium album]